MGLAGVRRHPANGRAGSDGRVVAVALLVFFALLPLQWVVPVGSTPLGQGRMHQLAILGLTAFVLVHYRPRVHAPVLHAAAVFVLANLYIAAGASCRSRQRHVAVPAGADSYRTDPRSASLA